MLSAEKVFKAFGTLEVLKGIDLTVEEGEVVAIVGASGAGKSTLLHVLGTLSMPDRGKVYIKDTDIFAQESGALARFRNKNIGFVFQFHNLLPEFSALENVMMPGLIAGSTKGRAKKKALPFMERLGLNGRLHHKPSQLSGGEQQRVAVARALVNSPSLIFADEPSGNLDSKNAQELHNLFFELRKELGHTFIIVTHNRAFADMADRKLTIKDGQMVS